MLWLWFWLYYSWLLLVNINDEFEYLVYDDELIGLGSVCYVICEIEIWWLGDWFWVFWC